MATIAQLREAAEKTGVDLTGLTKKDDIENALINAGVSIEVSESSEEEPSEPEEAEPEPAPISEGEEDVKPNSEPEEPVIRAGGYVIKDGRWALPEE